MSMYPVYDLDMWSVYIWLPVVGFAEGSLTQLSYHTILSIALYEYCDEETLDG